MRNNVEWDRGWFYLRKDGDSLPPYTGKVLDHRPFDSGPWVSDPVRREKFMPYMRALKTLTEVGLTEAVVLAQCNHGRVVPLMERVLPIYEMAEGTDLDALVRSQLRAEPLAPSYAKRAVDTRKVVCDFNKLLWSPWMRPDDGAIVLVRDFCYIFYLV
jgi:hypothetical protein